MGEPSLAGVDLKLDRADQHLAVLDGVVRASMAHADSVVGYLDPDTSEYVFRVDSEPPALDAGVPLSEWAHLMRSALDNMLGELLSLRRGQPISPKEQFGFPIREGSGKFKKDKSKPWMRDLWKDDRTFIEEAQPYKAPGPWFMRDPLFMLHKLNIIDKHRFFQIGFVATTQIVVDLAPDTLDAPVRILPRYRDTNYIVKWTLKQLSRSGGSLPGWMIGAVSLKATDCSLEGVIPMYTGGIAEDRTEIARVAVSDAGPNAQVQMQPAPTVAISLSGPELPVTIEDLNLIRASVRRVIDHFRAAAF